MASPTMASRLLDASDDLLRSRPKSTAYRRRAVSNSYYAVFHQLAKICADALLRGVSRDSDAYARVYRSLDHAIIKRSFDQAPLKDETKLRQIGQLVVALQSERHRADYMPPSIDLFPIEDVRRLIGQARQIIDDLDRLPVSDRMLLATCLLFKPR